MIRVFQLFFKLNYKVLSGFDFFNKSLEKINLFDYKCPFCDTKHPDWKRHDDYERRLICFKNGQAICYLIIVIRYKCSSCGHTHAILPESIIPYQSYSFLFILSVLSDYFTKSCTVNFICEKYTISASTLYSWKKLFLKHKKIWLGLLEDANTSSIQFLEYLFKDFIYCLNEFFSMSGSSFLQIVTSRRNAHSPPV
jgi:Domain of unknown function (DUF6431)